MEEESTDVLLDRINTRKELDEDTIRALAIGWLNTKVAKAQHRSAALLPKGPKLQQPSGRKAQTRRSLPPPSLHQAKVSFWFDEDSAEQQQAWAEGSPGALHDPLAGPPRPANKPYSRTSTPPNIKILNPPVNWKPSAPPPPPPNEAAKPEPSRFTPGIAPTWPVPSAQPAAAPLQAIAHTTTTTPSPPSGFTAFAAVAVDAGQLLHDPAETLAYPVTQDVNPHAAMLPAASSGFMAMMNFDDDDDGEEFI